MKHPYTNIIVAALCTILAAAADAQPYMGMTSKGASASYAYTLGGRDVGAYPRMTVDAAEAADGGMTVSYLFNLYDKKGRIHKSAKTMGLGEGLLYTVRYDEGAYYLTQDLIFAQADDRMGYFMKVPATLAVGQRIEGGTFSSTATVPMIGKLRTEITLSEMEVAEETEVTLDSGQTVHCYVIRGNVSGEASRTEQGGRIVFHFAPGIGIVREEVSAYLDLKQPYAARLTEYRIPE